MLDKRPLATMHEHGSPDLRSTRASSEQSTPMETEDSSSPRSAFTENDSEGSIVDRTPPMQPMALGDLGALSPIAGDSLTGHAWHTHPWLLASSNSNVMPHIAGGYHTKIAGHTSPIRPSTSSGPHSTFPISYGLPQTINEPDPRCSGESEERRRDLEERIRTLRYHQMTTAMFVFDKPRYYWQHRACCNLESRLFASRIGLQFPNPGHPGHGQSEDKSIYGRLKYVFNHNLTHANNARIQTFNQPSCADLNCFQVPTVPSPRYGRRYS